METVATRISTTRDIDLRSSFPVSPEPTSDEGQSHGLERQDPAGRNQNRTVHEERGAEELREARERSPVAQRSDARVNHDAPRRHGGHWLVCRARPATTARASSGKTLWDGKVAEVSCRALATGSGYQSDPMRGLLWLQRRSSCTLLWPSYGRNAPEHHSRLRHQLGSPLRAPTRASTTPSSRLDPPGNAGLLQCAARSLAHQEWS